MADLQGRKVFKVFNQEFIVDERYTVTKELGQGAYGIVWCANRPSILSPNVYIKSHTWRERRFPLEIQHLSIQTCHVASSFSCFCGLS